MSWMDSLDTYLVAQILDMVSSSLGCLAIWSLRRSLEYSYLLACVDATRFGLDHADLTHMVTRSMDTWPLTYLFGCTFRSLVAHINKQIHWCSLGCLAGHCSEARSLNSRSLLDDRIHDVVCWRR